MPSGVSFSGGPLEVIDDGASEGCPSDAVMTSPDGREECRWLSSRRRGRFVYVNTEGVTEVCDLRALGDGRVSALERIGSEAGGR